MRSLHDQVCMALVVVDALNGEDQALVGAVVAEVARDAHHFKDLSRLGCLTTLLAFPDLVRFGLFSAREAHFKHISHH